jgi:hypothetical protein
MPHGDLTDDVFLAAFEATTLPLAAFDHRAHVRAGYLYVTRLGFGAAIDRFSSSLKSFAAANGKAGLYHETITVAFLALINERVRLQSAEAGWAGFAAANPDLFAKDCLARFYGAEELAMPEAREVFLLPRRRTG